MFNNLIEDLVLWGLMADIVGAVFVAKAVFLRRNIDIFNTSGAYLEHSVPNTLSAIVAKREAILGSGFLILGFIGQFLGSLNNTPPHKDWNLITIFIIILSIISWLSSKIIKHWSENTVNELIKNMKNTKT